MNRSEKDDDIPLTINILTFNCWGLKYLAKWRNERLEEIGRSIAVTVPTPEIVGLQECWTQEDYLAIRRHTCQILPHGKFYYSGIFGGGLAILSKWPITESNMVRYPLNGRPTAFFRGDWFVGKGVACASIQIGSGRENVVEVFCTHLHAPYEREPNDSYMCHRTAQAWEIARLMRAAAERGHGIIGLGDFNMVPLSLAHQLITTHAPVQDVWRVLHPESSLGAASQPAEKERRKEIPDVLYNLRENGATCDSALNTWRWSKQQQKALSNGDDITVDLKTPDPCAKRLDYIFFGEGFPQSSTSHAQWRIESAKVGMTDRHPTLNCSLSDHFSVEATISRSLESRTTGPGTTLGSSSTHEQTRDTALRILTNSSLHPTLYTSYNPSPTSSILPPLLARTPSPSNPHPIRPAFPSISASLPSKVYGEILDIIFTYRAREHRQRRLRLSHFLASIVISVICFIAIWWSNHAGISFMLAFVSTLNFGAGVIDGLIGGLFVSSELRALKEFEWEIAMAQGVADQAEARNARAVEGIEAPEIAEADACHEKRDQVISSLESRKDGGEKEKELWEMVRDSKEYTGKENVRRGHVGMMQNFNLDSSI
ncbi:MAG: hypothetical protein L6R41_000316 [Letrouitia leprolyta]|nr:MAG: hypothetical protein L6R41_000316 [Letrouitia leprolyta]